MNSNLSWNNVRTTTIDDDTVSKKNALSYTNLILRMNIQKSKIQLSIIPKKGKILTCKPVLKPQNADEKHPE